MIAEPLLLVDRCAHRGARDSGGSDLVVNCTNNPQSTFSWILLHLVLYRGKFLVEKSVNLIAELPNFIAIGFYIT